MKLSLLMLFPASLVFLFLFPSNQQFPAAIFMYGTVQTDSTEKEWIDDFKTLRDAVYKNDKEKVKSFFNFPVMNPANEIWLLVLSEKERESKKMTDRIVPFTETDFIKYYKKLFPSAFTKTILKIKSSELFNKGETESGELKDGSTTYKMYASVDKDSNTLSLNLAYTVVLKEESSEIADGVESNVIYSFKILQNGHLQFMYVRLAG